MSYYTLDSSGNPVPLSDAAASEAVNEGHAVYYYSGSDTSGSSSSSGDSSGGWGGVGYDPNANAPHQIIGDEVLVYNAQTNRYESVSRSLVDAYNAQTTRAGTMGQIIKDSTGPANAFQYSNALHGQPNGGGAALFDMLAGRQGGQVGQPATADLHVLDLMKELRDLLGRSFSSGNSGGSTSATGGGTAATSTGGGTAASGTSGTAATDTTGTTSTATGGTTSTASNAPSNSTSGYSDWTDPSTGVTYQQGDSSGGGGHKGQSAYETRRDHLLGGQTHDQFQMAHSTTAQELNDVAKISDQGKREAAFRALQARPAWTPATSHGSNWRASGDGGQNPYRNAGMSYDYNAASGANASSGTRSNRGGGQNGNNSDGKGSGGGDSGMAGQRSNAQQTTDQSGAQSNWSNVPDDNSKHAARGTMQVATHPETIHVGEGGKDEAVFVYPLERKDTAVPPALLSLANTLSADRDGQRGIGNAHMAAGGGMVALPTGPTDPGTSPRSTSLSAMPAGPAALVPPAITSLGGGSSGGVPASLSSAANTSDTSGVPSPMPPDAGSIAPFDPTDPHPSPEALQEIRAVLTMPPDPHDPPIIQAVRRNWTLDSRGHPTFIGQQQQADAGGGGDLHLAEGGGVVYQGAAAPIGGGGVVNVTSANSKPNSAGQVKVPTAPGKTKRVPIAQTTPVPRFGDLTPALLSLLSPSDKQLLGARYSIAGGNVDDVPYLIQQNDPTLSNAPRVGSARPY